MYYTAYCTRLTPKKWIFSVHSSLSTVEDKTKSNQRSPCVATGRKNRHMHHLLKENIMLSSSDLLPCFAFLRCSLPLFSQHRMLPNGETPDSECPRRASMTGAIWLSEATFCSMTRALVDSLKHFTPMIPQL